MAGPKAKRPVRRLVLLAALLGGATLYRQYRLAHAPNPVPQNQR
jgi:hypothetical protein